VVVAQTHTKVRAKAADNFGTMSEAEAQHSLDDHEAPTLSSEEEQVLQWRYEELRRLGMNRIEARLIADSGTDLGVVRRLVEDGCPPSTAVRIVL
jgi:hypothetical protein